MIDRPIPAKIVLTLANNRLTGEEFISLSTDLYHQGLIFEMPREIRKDESQLILTVTFTSIFAYKNWLQQKRTEQIWSEKFQSFLKKLPETFAEKNLLLEVDSVVNCNCKESEIKFYLLEGRRYNFVSNGIYGLTCGNCLGLIPAHKIPVEIKLEEWLVLHEQVYSIWLQSGVLERWALKELKNYKRGKLNLEGQRIKIETSKFFNKPVYISFFEEEPDINTVCLICGNKGQKSGLRRPRQICNVCFTAFDFTK